MGLVLGSRQEFFLEKRQTGRDHSIETSVPEVLCGMPEETL